MSTKKSKKSAGPKKSAPKQQPNKPEAAAEAISARRVLILFGTDENKRPRAARFAEAELGLLAKAADAMNLKMCDVKQGKLSALASKLPVGRLHGSGSAFVPYVREDLYDKLVVAVGDEGSTLVEAPTAVGTPANFDEITPGHVVIAQENLEYGWWEAVVLHRDGETLTLRYRDYPRLPKFTRTRTAIALPCPAVNT